MPAIQTGIRPYQIFNTGSGPYDTNVLSYDAASGKFKWIANSTGIPEAPGDCSHYTRRNSCWESLESNNIYFGSWGVVGIGCCYPNDNGKDLTVGGGSWICCPIIGYAGLLVQGCYCGSTILVRDSGFGAEGQLTAEYGDGLPGNPCGQITIGSASNHALAFRSSNTTRMWIDYCCGWIHLGGSCYNVPYYDPCDGSAAIWYCDDGCSHCFLMLGH